MLKEKPARMTYAQRKLIDLVEGRKLRRWCMENGVTHSAAYRLALGEQVPTYKIIASMCHLISPIEWLFYEDEALPYKPALVPQWPCKEPSKFVLDHRYDYQTVAKKYSLDASTAYKIFVSYKASPTTILIRRACEETDPIDFFTAGKGEIKSLSEFVPDRGDIVSADGRMIFVVTKKEAAEKNKTYTGCLIVADCKGGMALKGTATKGFVNTRFVLSAEIAPLSPRTLIEKADDATTQKVLAAVRKNFK